MTLVNSSKAERAVFKRTMLSVILLIFLPPVFAAARQTSDSTANSPCKAAVSAVVQNDYVTAARLVKQCLDSESEIDATERAENLLLGAEIEFYLKNDEQAANYAALADELYESLTVAEQQALWLFRAKTKNIRAAVQAENGEYQSALEIYRQSLSILSAAGELLKTHGGEAKRTKADLLSGAAFVKLKTGSFPMPSYIWTRR